MEISEARETLATHKADHPALAKHLSLSDIRGKLAFLHRDHPQRAMKADLAISSIEEGLVHLSQLGHSFGLSERDLPAPVEYPKMLYSGNPKDLSTLTVQSEREELAALQSGYRLTPSLEESEVGVESGSAQTSDSSPSVEDQQGSLNLPEPETTEPQPEQETN